MLKHKKYFLCLSFTLILLTCSSCEEGLPEQSPSLVPSLLLTPTPSQKPDSPDGALIVSVSIEDTAQALLRGKELLERYNVQYGQTIRFPFKDYVFQSHGDVAITSIDEARSKYPHWTIPERLGRYEFIDLTVQHRRTSVVYANAVPPPKDSIEVLTDREPTQYYLCYGDGTNQFRINVTPITMDQFETDGFETLTTGFIPFPSHSSAYYCLESENSSLFDSLLIFPEEDRAYLFFIRKVTGDDCLEAEEISFSEEEASYIYNAIVNDFL